MGSLALQDFIENAGETSALQWHLQSNLYPPVSVEFAPAAREAIRNARAGLWNEQVAVPKPHCRTATLSTRVIVEGLHLGEFLREDDE